MMYSTLYIRIVLLYYESKFLIHRPECIGSRCHSWEIQKDLDTLPQIQRIRSEKAAGTTSAVILTILFAGVDVIWSYIGSR